MEVLILVLRWFHVIPTIAIVGDLIYMRFVLPKSLANGSDEQFALLRKRWAMIVMASSALLLVTGLTNMVLAGRLYDYGDDQANKMYQMLAGIKFLLALPVFFLAARLAGRSESAAKMRQKGDMWLNVTLIVALIVVMLGGYLRTLPRTAQVEAAVSVVLPLAD